MSEWGTPGPWEVLPDGKVGRVEVDIADWAYAGMPPDPEHRDSWQRNAALIVAAVNLLESLRPECPECPDYIDPRCGTCRGTDKDPNVSPTELVERVLEAFVRIGSLSLKRHAQVGCVDLPTPRPHVATCVACWANSVVAGLSIPEWPHRGSG